MNLYPKRIEKARQKMREMQFDCLLIGPSANMYYFSGLKTSPDERLQLLIIPKEGEAQALLPEMYLVKGEEYLKGNYKLFGWADEADPFAEAASLIGASAGGRFLIDDTLRADHLIGLGKTISASAFEPAGLVVDSLRAIKDDAEIALMKKAGQIADQVMERLSTEISPGMSELELSLMIEIEYKKLAGDISFKPIVASGPNAALPHHNTGSRRFEKGDFIVVDCGALFEGYCSDITRTICLGKADAQMKEVYNIVLEANQAAFSALGAKDGVSGEQADSAAREVIEKAGYKEYFIHRTGHGIGLEVHEAPYLVKGNRTPLVQGNAFTIEPGIYLPGRFGVRIEDMAALTDVGPQLLTNFKRELIEL